MYEDVEVPADIQRRADAGWTWFSLHIPASQRATAARKAERGYLDMGNIYEDVLAWAYAQDSDDVLQELHMDREQAQELGFRHVAAGGRDYDERTNRQDREVAEEYRLLTVAWYRNLTGVSEVTPETVLQASPGDLLKAIERLENQ